MARTIREEAGHRETAVTLEPIRLAQHESLLADWLQRPHVTRWWGDYAGRLDQLRATPGNNHAIIAAGGEPVGYVRWQVASREDLDAAGLTEIPTGSIDIDIFIGELGWIGKGLACRALRLLKERLATETNAPLAGLCTSVENHSAIRAFEKAGFQKLRQFDDPTGGRYWVLVAELTNPIGARS